MTELLFIGITVFFIYVVFQVVGKQEEPEADKADVQAVETPEPAKEAVVVPPSPPAASKPASSKRSTKASKAAPAKTAPTAPTPAPTPATTSDSLKNPKTGEIAKVGSNYAFAKRWIKDALVEEGLLDKVYKNNELDSEATAKIQDALQKLKAMPKYQ